MNVLARCHFDISAHRGLLVFVLGMVDPCVPLFAAFEPFKLELPVKLPMNYFARFFRARVGEASNPGPSAKGACSALRMAVTNPTTVHKSKMRLPGLELIWLFYRRLRPLRLFNMK